MKRNVQNTKFQTPNTQKGITLVALVITIIVLLILAGVAINMAINSDGLFGKANEAVTKWNSAVAEEDRIMQNILEQMNEINSGTTEGNDDDDDDDDDDSVTLPAGWDPTKVSAVVTEGTRKAPIPEGFVASQITAGEDGKGAENTISVGLVIYQGDDPVTGTAGSDAHNTAMTNRNQFVWIPVDDVNQMVMCKKNNQEEGSYVENGETITTKICKLELVTNEETKKEELVCKTHNNSTDLCGRLYGTDTNTSTTPYTTSMNFSDRTQTWTDDSGYREPAIVSNYDIDDTDTTTYMATAGIASGKVADFQAQFKNDFTAMATSVAKHGGFYVSRYESGVNGASLKNQKVLVAGATTATGYDTDTFINGNKWYGMYNTLRTSSAINKTAVNTHMIWGSQYDMIIKYLGENNINEPQVRHTERQLGTQELTGETTADIMSNIYDLEGNNYEWTAQAFSTSSRTYRGGSLNRVVSLNYFGPASGRKIAYANDTTCRLCSRSALYL